ncbi:734_t:CDS:2 [Ambispora gerdemannii]|uniref:734_t:CDS:1 n=1 Tax=Ambispora gerdemannii TaxID=144530 RepID=A0A9N9FUD5_9GLOM|nr:734_t:CDS:2 [Ambispora gerdemannii]
MDYLDVIIGAAETGSGKILAFGLPILQYLMNEEINLSIITLVSNMAVQRRLMDRHSNIIAATPGRLWEWSQR